MRFRRNWLLYLHCGQAISALTLALHPALSLSLRVQQDQVLIDVIATFIQRTARKSTLHRALRLPRLAPTSLSRAGSASRPGIVLDSAAFDQRKLVDVEQESRTLVHELVSLMVIHIAITGDEVLHFQ